MGVRRKQFCILLMYVCAYHCTAPCYRSYGGLGTLQEIVNDISSSCSGEDNTLEITAGGPGALTSSLEISKSMTIQGNAATPAAFDCGEEGFAIISNPAAGTRVNLHLKNLQLTSASLKSLITMNAEGSLVLENCEITVSGTGIEVLKGSFQMDGGKLNGRENVAVLDSTSAIGISEKHYKLRNVEIEYVASDESESAAGTGGGIGSPPSGLITVKKGRFDCTGTSFKHTSRATSKSTPGLVLLSDKPSIMTSCTFSFCEASEGGGVYATGSGEVTMVNCSFNQCKAAQKGGAAYFGANVTSVSITGGTASENEAGGDSGMGYGGAFWIGAPVSIASLTAQKNEAKGYLASSKGGFAFITQEDSSRKATITSSTVYNCSAGQGGGLWVEGNIELIGVTLQWCTAHQGGGVWWRNPQDTNAEFIATRTKFRQNRARNGGPALYDGANRYTTDSALTSWSPVRLTSIELSGNFVEGGRPSKGAALTLEGYGEFTYSGKQTWTDHNATEGAVIWTSRARLSIEDVTASRNEGSKGSLLYAAAPPKGQRRVLILRNIIVSQHTSNPLDATDTAVGKVVHIIPSNGHVEFSSVTIKDTLGTGAGAEIYIAADEAKDLSPTPEIRMNSCKFYNLASTRAVRIAADYRQVFNNLDFRGQPTTECTPRESAIQVWDNVCEISSGVPDSAGYYGCNRKCTTRRERCDTVTESPECIAEPALSPDVGTGGTVTPDPRVSEVPASVTLNAAKPDNAQTLDERSANFAGWLFHYFTNLREFYNLMWVGKLEVGSAGDYSIFAFTDGNGPTDPAVLEMSPEEAESYLKNHVIEQYITDNYVRYSINAATRANSPGSTGDPLPVDVLVRDAVSGDIIDSSRQSVQRSSAYIALSEEAKARQAQFRIVATGGGNIVFQATADGGLTLNGSPVRGCDSMDGVVVWKIDGLTQQTSAAFAACPRNTILSLLSCVALFTSGLLSYHT